MNTLLSLDFLKFAIPLLGAVIAWFVNQQQQRSRDEYLRKERLYRDLLDALQGFYESPPNGVLSQTAILPIDARKAKIQTFLDQVMLAWLYSPDAVVKKANAFLDTFTPATREDLRKEAFGDVVAAIRQDLLKSGLAFWRRSKLTGKDFRHARPS